ncbi:MAG: YhdH/YhfP family quinone oxidoreductase [Clostridiales Family XIII bacterium]|jgi:putative YhdH/YhfP family quinone oxidoreductase|nr:YhdH/YhfP family quinone oxidoreductase [Clostridiales Family XIII bacterium]
MKTNHVTEDTSYRALVVYEEDGGYDCRVAEKRIGDLPEGEVLIRVHYSSLNYKDALSAAGNKGVTKSYPHTPGVDAAGIVVRSDDPAFQEGDAVVVTGSVFGMSLSGGLQEYIRVPAGLPIVLPKGLDMRRSMEYGTAGITAAMCVQRLVERHGIRPEDGDVAVSGATGGVGCYAVQLLARLGYRVIAATSKADAASLMEGIGAAQVIDRSEIDDTSGRPLMRPRWKAAIDTTGGNILATLIKTTAYDGAIACCGNAAGGDLHTTVFPFILNGVTLYGVDSVSCTTEYRRSIWELLAGPWSLPSRPEMLRTIPLEAVPDALAALRAGTNTGRVVVEL